MTTLWRDNLLRLNNQKANGVPRSRDWAVWAGYFEMVNEAEAILIQNENNQDLKALLQSLIDITISSAQIHLEEEGCSENLARLNFTIADIQASLEALEDKKHRWFGEQNLMSTEESETILKSVFHGIS